MLFRYHTTPEGNGLVDLLHDDARSSGVECLMSPLEPLVYDTLCGFLPDDARAAEIGSFVGGSCCILSHGMRRRGRRLSMFCHDLFEPFEIGGKSVDIEPRFDDAVARWGFEPTKVKGPSSETLGIHADGTLDYCFVDGDHTYEGALADIKGFAPKVKPDGWLVIQDSIGDVHRAVVDALSATEWSAVLISPPHGHYVTVCTRDPRRLDAFVGKLHTVMAAAATPSGVAGEPCRFPDV
jgi:hypothetical protein